ncbi:MAG TPA: hypothetical protein VKZ18_19265 [Polyangia bacterium]|nr:hypothetical protein [Polyangia bacterium]
MMQRRVGGRPARGVHAVVAGGLMLLGSCGGELSSRTIADAGADAVSDAGVCRPPAAPPPGQKCGPVNTNAQPQSGVDCGPWGFYVMEEGRCEGAANACCTGPIDCYNGECLDGVCSSILLPCGCDSDCTFGAVCGGTQGTCIKFPGAPCVLEEECSACYSGGSCDSTSACAPNGVCGCAEPQPNFGPPCRSNADCCNGACISGQCLLAGEGGPCTTEADCANGQCMSGVCRCLPAGTPITGYAVHCCDLSDTARTLAPNTCGTGAGDVCSPTLPDCYGGPCVGGRCSCVGVGGGCWADTDCCASATHCVTNTCQ